MSWIDNLCNGLHHVGRIEALVSRRAEEEQIRGFDNGKRLGASIALDAVSARLGPRRMRQVAAYMAQHHHRDFF